jgi:hypothetical protein
MLGIQMKRHTAPLWHIDDNQKFRLLACGVAKFVVDGGIKMDTSASFQGCDILPNLYDQTTPI